MLFIESPIPFVFVFYALVSLQLIAEEIEDPFGKETNDPPMDRMFENIKKNQQTY